MAIKKTYYILNIVTVITVAMFFSCKDNYNEVQKIGISENEPVSIGEDINFKKTDSGRVTANLISDKRLDYSNRSFPYEEFPEGITLYVYDNKNKKSTIISDYAIQYTKTKLIDLQGNVKIVTQIYDTLFAEQLYYDDAQQWIYTNTPVSFKTKKEIINGNGFDSNKDFSNAEVLEVTGIISLEE